MTNEISTNCGNRSVTHRYNTDTNPKFLELSVQEIKDMSVRNHGCEEDCQARILGRCNPHVTYTKIYNQEGHLIRCATVTPARP